MCGIYVMCSTTIPQVSKSLIELPNNQLTTFKANTYNSKHEIQIKLAQHYIVQVIYYIILTR